MKTTINTLLLLLFVVAVSTYMGIIYFLELGRRYLTGVSLSLWFVGSPRGIIISAAVDQ